VEAGDVGAGVEDQDVFVDAEGEAGTEVIVDIDEFHAEELVDDFAGGELEGGGGDLDGGGLAGLAEIHVCLTPEDGSIVRDIADLHDGSFGGKAAELEAAVGICRDGFGIGKADVIGPSAEIGMSVDCFHLSAGDGVAGRINDFTGNGFSIVEFDLEIGADFGRKKAHIFEAGVEEIGVAEFKADGVITARFHGGDAEAGEIHADGDAAGFGAGVDREAAVLVGFDGVGEFTEGAGTHGIAALGGRDFDTGNGVAALVEDLAGVFAGVVGVNFGGIAGVGVTGGGGHSEEGIVERDVEAEVGEGDGGIEVGVEEIDLEGEFGGRVDPEGPELCVVRCFAGAGELESLGFAAVDDFFADGFFGAGVVVADETVEIEIHEVGSDGGLVDKGDEDEHLFGGLIGDEGEDGGIGAEIGVFDGEVHGEVDALGQAGGGRRWDIDSGGEGVGEVEGLDDVGEGEVGGMAKKEEGESGDKEESKTGGGEEGMAALAALRGRGGEIGGEEALADGVVEGLGKCQRRGGEGVHGGLEARGFFKILVSKGENFRVDVFHGRVSWGSIWLILERA